MKRTWRTILLAGAACFAGVASLEAFANGADDPQASEILLAPNDYAQSVCSHLMASRTPAREPCAAAGEIGSYLSELAVERAGYVERFEWTCKRGGRLAIWVRTGVNWTGLCLRCRSARGETQCPL